MDIAVKQEEAYEDGLNAGMNAGIEKGAREKAVESALNLKIKKRCNGDLSKLFEKAAVND